MLTNLLTANTLNWIEKQVCESTKSTMRMFIQENYNVFLLQIGEKKLWKRGRAIYNLHGVHKLTKDMN